MERRRSWWLWGKKNKIKKNPSTAHSFHKRPIKNAEEQRQRQQKAAANFSISERYSVLIWKERLSGKRLALSCLIMLEGSNMDV